MTLACNTSAGEKEKIVASEQSPLEENRPEDEFSFIDQSQAPDRLPIFPLPNVLLFPNMVVPLHIFEERYKRMVSDCLQGNHSWGCSCCSRAGTRRAPSR